MDKFLMSWVNEDQSENYTISLFCNIGVANDCCVEYWEACNIRDGLETNYDNFYGHARLWTQEEEDRLSLTHELVEFR